FSGDTVISWASLDFQPYFTATASNAGYGWWSHDIGGHMKGVHDEELAVRWIQFGVFSPINRLHSTSSLFNGKEPWHYSTTVCGIMAEFLRLRHRLIPYLYSMNRRASRDGESLVQPLYYAEPENDEAYRVPNEYYFGSELLCCPLTVSSNCETRKAGFKAWLPPGIWIDFFNGRIYSGGRLLQLWRGLETMPVLAKAGGIVPLAETTANSVENPMALELFVFAGAEGSLRLWEDPGDGKPDDSDENWAETLFSLDWENGQFIISPAQGNLAAIPAARSWTLRFWGFAETALYVNAGDRQIPVLPVYDKSLNRLSLSIPSTPVNTEIRIEFKKAGLAQNDTMQMLFDFLDKAWIEYDTKSRVFDLLKINSSPVSYMAALHSLDLSDAIYSGISEILCACIDNS
ncbi:MAG: DUF5110 domain-containing protein, partial [Treponema sp.]|nr:DUF5110 domain-containing protein [Treponema sp.]